MPNCKIFLIGFGNDTDHMQQVLTEYLSRKDTEFDKGDYAVSGDFEVIGTTRIKSFQTIDRWLIPACRLCMWPEDCLIWVYNDADKKIVNSYKDLVQLKFGREYRDRALGFMDPYTKGIAYAPPYSNSIKHEWAHLLHGPFHGNEGKYAWG